MPGPLIAAGITPSSPGVYFVLDFVGDVATPVAGVVAAVFRADDGPLNAWVDIRSLSRLYATYGSPPGADANSGVEVAAEALRGGATLVRCYRIGDATGVKATRILTDTTGSPAPAVDLAWKNVGKGGLLGTVTVEDSLDDPTGTRELRLFVSGVEKLVVRFPKGSTGLGEPQLLVNAIAASGNPYITAALHAAYAGTKILTAVSSPAAFTGGTNPAVVAADVEAGVGAAEGVAGSWNVLAIDSVSTSIQTAIAALAALWESRGIYRMLVLGDPPSVTADPATRAARAAVFNQPNLVYVIDAFTDSAGATVEGAAAAGRVAGLIAQYGTTQMLTGRRLTGARTLPYALSADDQEGADANGALTFTVDDRGYVVIYREVTSFVTPDEIRSRNWGRILRVLRRYAYFIELSSTLRSLLFDGSGIEDDINGINTLVGATRAVLKSYIQRRWIGPTSTATAEVEDEADQGDGLVKLTHLFVDHSQIDRVINTIQFP